MDLRVRALRTSLEQKGQSIPRLGCSIDPVPPALQSGKRIEYLHTSGCEVLEVAGDNDEIVNQRCCCNLLVQRVLKIWYTEPAPYMSSLFIER